MSKIYSRPSKACLISHIADFRQAFNHTLIVAIMTYVAEYFKPHAFIVYVSLKYEK